MTATTTTNNNTQFFNLTAKGVGFINRITHLKTKGNPVSLTLNASYGNKDDKNRSRFELYVKGSDALKIFQELELQENDVMTCAFDLGDITPDILRDSKTNEYITTKNGDMIPVIRGNLLKVTSLKLKRNGTTTVIVGAAESTAAEFAPESTPAPAEVPSEAPAATETAPESTPVSTEVPSEATAAPAEAEPVSA